MSLLNTLRKATSLLVEMPPEPKPIPFSSSDVPDMEDIDLELPPEARLQQSKTIEQIVHDTAGPDLSEIKVAPEAIPVGVEEKPLDFPSIYRAAKLPEVAFGAEQMLETLSNLPSELPLETKRLTVRAMLSTLGKASGATPETIVADASRKLAALASFENFMSQRTGETIEKAQAEISNLEAQIEARKAAIQAAKNQFAQIQSECERESDKIDDVLEFFSLDVGASKLAPNQQVK
jgi:hypothetical protein